MKVTMTRKETRKETDRQKERHHVALDARVYAAIAELARRNKRPVSWEIELHLIEVLKAAGMWEHEDGE